MPPHGSLRTVSGGVVAVLTTVMALLVGSAGPAGAHAYLEHTNPADGAVVQRAPDRLALYFSEHVVLESTTIEVVDGTGRAIALTRLMLESAEPDETEAPSVVTASLPDLPRDAYRVRWSTLSSDDLHRTSGTFVFGVGTQVLPAGFNEPTPRGSESGLRWLLLLGLALALGSGLVGRLSPLETDGARRTRAVGRLGAGTAVVVSLALMADQVVAGGLSWSDVTSSGYATRWTVREAGLLLVVFAVASTRTRAGPPMLVVGATTAALGSALLGHAGADAGPAYTRVLVTAVHLLAMLSWSGGVLCLAVLLARRRPPGGTDQLDVRFLLRSFGAPAAFCLGLGVATGVYLSSAAVASVDAALQTTYGRWLLLKIALVVLMACAAMANHRRLRGRHDLDLPRRGVLAEAAAAVLVLGATAVLTSAQPATESRFLTPPPATVGPASAEAADLHVAMDVAPNLPGINVVSIDVFDTRRPAPSQVTAVALTIEGVVTEAAPLADGRWTVAGLDLTAGTRTLRLTVTRPGLADASLDTVWTTGPGRSGYQPLISTAPARSWLRALAGLALATWMFGVVAALRRRRRGAASDGGVTGGIPGPPPRRGAQLQDTSRIP